MNLEKAKKAVKKEYGESKALILQVYRMLPNYEDIACGANNEWIDYWITYPTGYSKFFNKYRLQIKRLFITLGYDDHIEKIYQVVKEKTGITGRIILKGILNGRNKHVPSYLALAISNHAIETICQLVLTEKDKENVT